MATRNAENQREDYLNVEDSAAFYTLFPYNSSDPHCLGIASEPRLFDEVGLDVGIHNLPEAWEGRNLCTT